MRSPTQPPPCLHPTVGLSTQPWFPPLPGWGFCPPRRASARGSRLRDRGQGWARGCVLSPLRSVPSLLGPLLRDRELSMEAAWEFTHKGPRPTRAPKLRSQGGSARSPPASSLHLVAARAWSHEGPKEGSQGPQQGKGSPRGRGTGPEQGCGCRAMRGRLIPSPSSP